MKQTAYAIVDVIPVVYLERQAADQPLDTEQLSDLVYRYVEASTALYRYAQRVAGRPCRN